MYRDFTRHKLQVVLFILALTLQAHPCRGDALTTATVDLRAYGWEPQARKQRVWNFVAIDRDGRTVVGYVTRVRTHLVMRDNPSLDLRIFRFSSDGKQTLSLSLPTRLAGTNDIYLSDIGQIIARANDSLQLYQEDTRAWKVLASCGPQCSVWQSVSRRTLVIRDGYHAPFLVIRLSPTPRLQQCDKALESSEDSHPYSPQAISDEFAYYSGSYGLERFAYRWPFCEYENREEMPLRLSHPVIVFNDRVFLFYREDPRNDQRTVRVVSADGRTIFQSANRKHEHAGSIWAPIRSSEQGSRIADDIVTLRGGNRALDISSHPTARRIAVYDIGLQKEVASIPVSWKGHSPLEVGFDLSPDGQRLAILENGILKVIDLDGKNTGGGTGSKLSTEKCK